MVGESECDLIPYLTLSQNPLTSNLFLSGTEILSQLITCWKSEWEYVCYWKCEIINVVMKDHVFNKHAYNLQVTNQDNFFEKIVFFLFKIQSK